MNFKDERDLAATKDTENNQHGQFVKSLCWSTFQDGAQWAISESQLVKQMAEALRTSHNAFIAHNFDVESGLLRAIPHALAAYHKALEEMK